MEYEGDDTFVYVKTGEEGNYERRKVTTGLSDGLNIEIKEGLKKGEKVRGNKVVNY